MYGTPRVVGVAKGFSISRCYVQLTVVSGLILEVFSVRWEQADEGENLFIWGVLPSEFRMS